MGFSDLGCQKMAEQPMAMPTKYSERIAFQLSQARERVAQLERISELLRENPQIEELLTLSSQAGIY